MVVPALRPSTTIDESSIADNAATAAAVDECPAVAENTVAEITVADVAVMKSCIVCDEKCVKVKKCKLCKSGCYCSRECRKKDVGRHAEICGHI